MISFDIFNNCRYAIKCIKLLHNCHIEPNVLFGKPNLQLLVGNSPNFLLNKKLCNLKIYFQIDLTLLNNNQTYKLLEFIEKADIENVVFL
jgi:hypothetical protein